MSPLKDDMWVGVMWRWSSEKGKSAETRLDLCYWRKQSSSNKKHTSLVHSEAALENHGICKRWSLVGRKYIIGASPSIGINEFLSGARLVLVRVNRYTAKPPHMLPSSALSQFASFFSAM